MTDNTFFPNSLINRPCKIIKHIHTDYTDGFSGRKEIIVPEQCGILRYFNRHGNPIVERNDGKLVVTGIEYIKYTDTDLKNNTKIDINKYCLYRNY